MPMGTTCGSTVGRPESASPEPPGPVRPTVEPIAGSALGQSKGREGIG
jgi:hypothetical protein